MKVKRHDSIGDIAVTICRSPFGRPAQLVFPPVFIDDYMSAFDLILLQVVFCCPTIPQIIC
ncbi:MAG: hypothetical protein GY865_14915 [candidate division Zixibacteria bacterium]|nr:hypothetical protein [candidate division Zixibacteria bacterium]